MLSGSETPTNVDHTRKDAADGRPSSGHGSSPLSEAETSNEPLNREGSEHSVLPDVDDSSQGGGAGSHHYDDADSEVPATDPETSESLDDRALEMRRQSDERFPELDLGSTSRRTRSRGRNLGDDIVHQYIDERVLRGRRRDSSQNNDGRRNKSVDPHLFSSREHSPRREDEEDIEVADISMTSSLSNEQVSAIQQAIAHMTPEQARAYFARFPAMQGAETNKSKPKSKSAWVESIPDEDDDPNWHRNKDVSQVSDFSGTPEVTLTPKVKKKGDSGRRESTPAEQVQSETVNAFIQAGLGTTIGPKDKSIGVQSNTKAAHPLKLLPKNGTMGKLMRGLSGGPSDPSDGSDSSSENGNNWKPDHNRDPKGKRSESKDNDSERAEGGDPLPSDPDSSDSDGPGPKRNKKGSDKKSNGSSRRRSHSVDISSDEERIKPIEPRPYDGSEDLAKFQTFMFEIKDYLEAGKVKPKRQVRVTGRFLTGVAREYFMGMVVSNSEAWTLFDFFSGLFNHVFKQNFRTVLREDIENFRQTSDITVRQYAIKLQAKFAMLPGESDRTKVLQLWKGLRNDTRRELLKKGLNQEYSTWEDTVVEAERIEYANREFKAQEAKDRAERRAVKFYSAEEDRRDYEHHQRAINRVNNDGVEQNKYNKVLRRDHDYRPKPVPQSNEDKGRQWFGKPQKNGSRPFKAPSNAPKVKRARTEQERKKYQEEGRCYRCGSTEHIARNCASRHNVQSNSPDGGPPGLTRPSKGVSSNAVSLGAASESKTVGLNLAQVQLRHNSVKQSESSTALRCNAVSLVDLEGSDDEWVEPRENLRSDRRSWSTHYGGVAHEVPVSPPCGYHCWEDDCTCYCHNGLIEHDDFARILSRCEEVGRRSLRQEPIGDIRQIWTEWYLNRSAELFPECDEAPCPRFRVTPSAMSGWYIIEDIHFCDDPFDEGHWEVSADFLDSGNVLGKMVELTFQRLASREGFKWDEFLEIYPERWWEDIKSSGNNVHDMLDLRINLQIMRMAKRFTFDFSEHSPSCIVTDTLTRNEAFITPEQYLNPKFQIVNWTLVRLNGRGSDSWANIQDEQLSTLYMTDQFFCNWESDKWLAWIGQALLLWPSSKLYSDLQDYWTAKAIDADLEEYVLTNHPSESELYNENGVATSNELVTNIIRPYGRNLCWV
jgi:hypothetical protein